MHVHKEYLRSDLKTETELAWWILGRRLDKEEKEVGFSVAKTLSESLTNVLIYFLYINNCEII